MRKVALGLVVGLVLIGVILAGGELAVRAGRALELGRLGDPRSFAQPYCDPDFHKLRLQARADAGIPAVAVDGYTRHPQLGWAPDAQLAERLGLVSDGRPVRADVALFGDSFTAGVPPTRPEERMGPILDGLLGQRRVLNYAVPGYGVDQIELRFRDVVSDDRTRPETAVVVLLVDDIDRVVQPVRAAPKPYYVLDGHGALQLRNVPIEQDAFEWLAEHPISIRSYLAALVRTRWSERRDGPGFYSHCRREEKEAITTALLESIVDEARARDVRVFFVILYGEMAAGRPSWRTGFLKSALDDLGADFLDLRPVILAAAAERPRGAGAFYFPAPNFHPNETGNRLFARAIADALGGPESAGPP